MGSTDRRAYNQAVLVLCIAASATCFSAMATGADFYSGKTISIIVASAPGGSYDVYPRVLGRHWPRHIPGSPTFVIQNMQGGGGALGASHLQFRTAQDGTYLGALLNTTPLTQLTTPEMVKYDVGTFHWIGAIASPTNVLVTWHTSGVRTMEDARQKSVTIGGASPGTTKDMYPNLANALFGTKFQVVVGYTGTSEINFAMERGEVQGHGSNTWLSYKMQTPDWVRDKKIHPIFQMTFERDPELPDVPTLLEYAKTTEERRVVEMLATTELLGRSIAAPGGVPADRVALLRQTFSAALKDPAFLEEAEKAQLEISPTPGERLQTLVSTMMASPPEAVEKFKALARAPRR